MPWYRAGQVAITAGQNTVTGTGTAFSANARVGDAFQGPDGRWYEVTNIASTTVLSIFPAYQGATVAGGSYALAPMQGYVKESADRLRQIVSDWGGTLALFGGAIDAVTLRANIGALGKGDFGLGGNIAPDTAVPAWLGNRFTGWAHANPSGPIASQLSVGLDMGYSIARRFQFALAGNGDLYTRVDVTKEPTDRADWRRYFSDANVVGTVSQLGGIPKGALIERGSNANGEYVRFADGTQIAWTFRTDNATLNAAFATGFMTEQLSWNFPIGFSGGAPAVSVTGRRQSGMSWPFNNGNAGANNFSYYHWWTAAISTVTPFHVHLIAIGRWY
ncbi:hypothetical protein [Pseudomonas sp. DG56-2]|uniref:hypothetical protein n=1 Tax=Pseudomonas sp. DG56-2 TaxID=2320270 RepID=UPI0010A68A0D|nr:hypothetical protein [Pseudomonas sp. DG56-2]